MNVIIEKFVKVWTNFGNLIENFKVKKILKVFKKILIKIWKNLTIICNFSYTIDSHSLSSQKFVFGEGGRSPGSPHGAATD